MKALDDRLPPIGDDAGHEPRGWLVDPLHPSACTCGERFYGHCPALGYRPDPDADAETAAVERALEARDEAAMEREDVG